jgi:putative transcriptional regulator
LVAFWNRKRQVEDQRVSRDRYGVPRFREDTPANGKGVAIMKKEHFEKLVASVKEAGEIKAGRKPPSRMYEIKAPEIKTVREKLNVSQSEFALLIGVTVRTLQNWEQGRRKPEGPAKALLRIASKNPGVVLDALHAE